MRCGWRKGISGPARDACRYLRRTASEPVAGGIVIVVQIRQAQRLSGANAVGILDLRIGLPQRGPQVSSAQIRARQAPERRAAGHANGLLAGRYIPLLDCPWLGGRLNTRLGGNCGELRRLDRHSRGWRSVSNLVGVNHLLGGLDRRLSRPLPNWPLLEGLADWLRARLGSELGQLRAFYCGGSGNSRTCLDCRLSHLWLMRRLRRRWRRWHCVSGRHFVRGFVRAGRLPITGCRLDWFRVGRVLLSYFRLRRLLLNGCGSLLFLYANPAGRCALSANLASEVAERSRLLVGCSWSGYRLSDDRYGSGLGFRRRARGDGAGRRSWLGHAALPQRARIVTQGDVLVYVRARAVVRGGQGGIGVGRRFLQDLVAAQVFIGQHGRMMRHPRPPLALRARHVPQALGAGRGDA